MSRKVAKIILKEGDEKKCLKKSKNKELEKGKNEREN